MAESQDQGDYLPTIREPVQQIAKGQEWRLPDSIEWNMGRRVKGERSVS